jgi:hypothetical protein
LETCPFPWFKTKKKKKKKKKRGGKKSENKPISTAVLSEVKAPLAAIDERKWRERAWT